MSLHEGLLENDARDCVYTCLFGGYEELLEQPTAHQSSLDYLCFTDDPSLRSDTWQVLLTESAVPEDPQRSSRYPKILAHRVLPGYDRSLYIDNSVLLLRPPEEGFHHFLPTGALAGFVEHSFRETLSEEFEVVEARQLDAASVLEEQRRIYTQLHPEILGQRPLIGGVLFRRHRHPLVMMTMEVWWRWVISYSRRDQLSLLAALEECGLEPHVSRLDIKDNPYWRWPVPRRH